MKHRRIQAKQKTKILFVFDDMIAANILSNKKLNSVATEFFVRGRKLNISLVFTKQSYFIRPKNVRLDTTYFFIMKTPNKRRLQQIQTLILKTL